MKVRNLSYHVAKLFGSRTGPNSHIWLEGERLTAAGFAPGTPYSQVWYADKLICTQHLAIGVEFEGARPLKTVRRVVSLKGGDPAIRIEGVRVHETFGKHGVSVRVSYQPGIITIDREGVIAEASIPKGVITHNETAELAEMGVRL